MELPKYVPVPDYTPFQRQFRRYIDNVGNHKERMALVYAFTPSQIPPELITSFAVFKYFAESYLGEAFHNIQDQVQSHYMRMEEWLLAREKSSTFCYRSSTEAKVGDFVTGRTRHGEPVAGTLTALCSGHENDGFNCIVQYTLVTKGVTPSVPPIAHRAEVQATFLVGSDERRTGEVAFVCADHAHTRNLESVFP